ncbi:MAG: glycoside hydrolase family 15 protein [Thermoplasmatota archaeon]
MIAMMSGNSRILVTMDGRGSWSELYYPHPGLHQQLQRVRVGLFDQDDEAFEWLDKAPGEDFETTPIDASDGARTRVRRLGLDVTVDDAVHPNLDLIVRRFSVNNPGDSMRRVRLFHYQSLNIGGSVYQGTAYWDTARKTVNHYRGDTYFQFLGRPDFDHWSCGEHTLKGLRGSYVDAEDGKLEGNAISHGAADSIVQWNLDVAPGQSRIIHLLIAIGRSRREMHDVHRLMAERDPALYMSEAIGYNNNWASRSDAAWAGLDPHVALVYRRSLFVMRNCQATTGAIVASPDSRTLNIGGDTYNYNWWRDGAYISMALSDSGLHQAARRFLRFAALCQEPEGPFLHRHLPDGALGSTWHPPPFLQVDQTGSVVDAVRHAYQCSGDLEALLDSWPMVRQAADWLMGFVDSDGLPLPTFDLWEERSAVNAYSVAAVIRGLKSAATVGKALSKRVDFWADAAERMHRAAGERFWNPARKTFWKSLNPEDATIDASALLALRLGFLSPGDARFRTVVETVESRLWNAKVGGLARYEGDQYYGPENPWIICTLWLADCHLSLGNSQKASSLVRWCCEQATGTGLLPEQVDAATGEPTSVLPLVWSHSTLVEVVNRLARTPGPKPVAPTPQLVPSSPAF